MSVNKKYNQLVEERNQGKKWQEKYSPIIKRSGKDKNDIIIELSDNKENINDNSAKFDDYSGINLKKEEKSKKPKKEEEKKSQIKNKKTIEKYVEKMKEKTMRMELENMQKETERLKEKYEIGNLYLHKFNNNKAYQKMLKTVEKQLILMFCLGAALSLFNALIFFSLTGKKEGLALAGFATSLAEMPVLVILFILLKLKLLNDPELSKGFRFFIIFGLLITISSFVITMLVTFLSEFIEESGANTRFVVYLLFFIVAAFFIYTIIFCFSLFKESILILCNKKTEYSVLIINEQKADSCDENVSASINELITDSNTTSSNFINGKVIANNKNSFEEQQYKIYNYYDKFHYSCTSNRNGKNY